MSDAYRLGAAGLRYGADAVLRDLELGIPDAGVTAIVGPSGVGKSTLLSALTNPLPASLVREGEWSLFGEPPEGWRTDEIVISPQRRAQSEHQRLDALLARPARILLLDEPLAQCNDPALLDGYTALLRGQRARGPVIMVSHNLELVRRLADHVVLLCAGRLECAVDTTTFFERPPTPLASQFVRQGNCWPRPVLPGHFHWITPSLAGMGRPGLLNEVERDLAALSMEGVDVLVSLTQRRLPQDVLSGYGIVGRHLPIPDMGVPSVNLAAAQCREVQRAIEAGSRVAFHCDAGLGRTGTMLASYLAWTGEDAETAIERVRHVIRGAIQTEAQLGFVRRFASAYGHRR